jgi:hypothetical protein
MAGLLDQYPQSNRGLLADVLPWVYSKADRIKRNVKGLLSDPATALNNAMAVTADQTNAMNRDAATAWGGDMSTPEAQAAGGRAIEGLLGGPLAFAPVAATVYHGSPHKFDKFDASKIGTGEGAQAYGHGLYLAESPDVAKSYSKLGEVVSIDGTKVSTAGSAAIQDAAKKLGMTDAGINYLGLHNWDVSKASTELTKELSEAKTIGDKAWIHQLLGDMNRLRKSKIDVQAGNTYKVDLPDSAIAKMLDWDKPLSQQAPEVQAVLSEFKNKGMPSPNGLREMTGEEIVAELGRQHSQSLQTRGIPGIRYLDGGSRGAGSGTSNYVVFPGNEGLLSILERNGQPLK